MYVLSPLLNKLIVAVNKEDLKKILVLFAFIPVYAQFSPTVISAVVYFVYVYLLIGYIKKYGMDRIEKYASIQFVVLTSISIIAAKLILYTGGRLEGLPMELIRWLVSFTFAATGRHSMIILIDALLIFFWVLKMPARENKTINKMAGYTLGIYLFHESSIEPNILDSSIANLQHAGYFTANAFFPLEYLALVTIVFFAGLLVEIVRSRIIQEPAMQGIESRFAKGLDRIDLWMEMQKNTDGNAS